MKKTKVKERSNIFSRHFDAGFDGESALLAPTRSGVEPEPPTGGDRLVTFLKRTFLFIPGTFFLFYLSLGIGMIGLEILVFRRDIQQLPDAFPFHLALFLIPVLGTAAMVLFGYGDFKNKKHLLIPASVSLLGISFGAIVKVAASFSSVIERLMTDFGFLVYLFPLALIVAVLTKGFIDRKRNEKSIGESG